MARYEIVVKVSPRVGLLDPAGQAVEGSLKNLGNTGVSELSIGKLIKFKLEADSEKLAETAVNRMCIELLVNPITEDQTIEVTEI